MSTAPLVNSRNQLSIKKPDWLKVKLPGGPIYNDIKKQVTDHGLATVCEEARCPNIAECWASGTATFMLLGDTCTRGCRFCSVKTGNPAGLIDTDEPIKVAKAVSRYNLKYVVLTSVDRDDLEDFGSNHFAKTISTIKEKVPGIIVEVLIPDFQGCEKSLQHVIEPKPEVIAHNIETTRVLTSKVRDKRAHYEQSLKVLQNIKKISPITYTKSSIMVGFGETEKDVLETLEDLRGVDVDIVTVGQYLQPTKKHLPVTEYIAPSRFDYYKEKAYEFGFSYVASGPLVRSSYKASEAFVEGIIKRSSSH